MKCFWNGMILWQQSFQKKARESATVIRNSGVCPCCSHLHMGVSIFIFTLMTSWEYKLEFQFKSQWWLQGTEMLVNVYQCTFFFLKLRANIYAQDCANYTYFVETQLSIVFLAQKCFNLNPDDTSLHEADELFPQSLYFPWRGSSIVNTNCSQWNCLIYYNFRRKLKLNNYGTTIVLILYNERKKKCIHQCLIFYCKNKKKIIMQICL